MRLLITGKTRSGKSTAFHRLISELLRYQWRHVVILDGKGTEMHPYAGLPRVQYFGHREIGCWADALEELAEDMDMRYAQLIDAGLTAAPPDQKATLLIIDEAQKGTRARPHGTRIKNALSTLAEQAAALGDVMLLGCQRLQTAIPPNVRENCNAELRLLGHGYFQLVADGMKRQAGRVSLITAAETLTKVKSNPEGTVIRPQPAQLPEMLNATIPPPRDGRSTLYLGAVGSGRTHALHTHKQGTAERIIYADLSHSHKQVLESLIEELGAVLPPKANIHELAEIASIALTAEPTLLLLDNAEQASEKARATLVQLMAAAHETAVGALSPETLTQEKRLAFLIPRCEIVDLRPLTDEEARRLALENIPARVKDREQTLRRIIDLAEGHPATIVSMARRTQSGTLEELRAYRKADGKPFPLGWIALVLAAAMLMAARRDIDSYWLLVLAFAAYLVIRPMIYRLMR